jgi:tRNA(Ile)-lysidine synthase
VRKKKIMMEEKVATYLKYKNFQLKGTRIAVGVSGGPDSLALLHYLWRKQESFNLYLVVVHVDHMFRGEESYEEAKFVGEFCEARNIPFKMKRIDVPGYIEATGKSSQVAARECRYQFFSEIMEEQKLTHLALAHHGDDQIETMLMRWTRGSSGAARAGIPFERPFAGGSIFRPFLCLDRQDIEAYCKEHQLEPRYDPSNTKEDYLRNRFRKYVVPFLKRENTHVHEHFQRLSEELQADEKLLQELTAQKMNTVLKEQKQDKITLEIAAFQTMAIPLQRRGIQLILNYLYKKRPVSLSAVHIDSVLSLISNSHPSGSLDLPNKLRVIKSYQNCYFTYGQEEYETFEVELFEAGSVILPNGDSIILEEVQNFIPTNSPNTFLVDKEELKLPLTIRTRREGDRMSVKGMVGTKKIKDIFIDSKVPRTKRNNWPIITDSQGNLIWLPGLKKGNLISNTHSEVGYFLLTYKKAPNIES